MKQLYSSTCRKEKLLGLKWPFLIGSAASSTKKNASNFERKRQRSSEKPESIWSFWASKKLNKRKMRNRRKRPWSNASTKFSRNQLRLSKWGKRRKRDWLKRTCASLKWPTSWMSSAKPSASRNLQESLEERMLTPTPSWPRSWTFKRRKKNSVTPSCAPTLRNASGSLNWSRTEKRSWRSNGLTTSSAWWVNNRRPRNWKSKCFGSKIGSLPRNLLKKTTC